MDSYILKSNGACNELMLIISMLILFSPREIPPYLTLLSLERNKNYCNMMHLVFRQVNISLPQHGPTCMSLSLYIKN